LQDDARLLERAQHGLGNFEAAATFPVDLSQDGLCWFVERCRNALAPAPGKARPRRARPRKAAAVPTG